MKKLVVDLNPELKKDEKTEFYASLHEEWPIVKIYISDDCRDGYDVKVLTANMYPGSREQWESSTASRLESKLLELGIITEDNEKEQTLNLKDLS